MTAKLIFLTNEDRAYLRSLRQKDTHRNLNERNRDKGDKPQQPADIYIAKVPGGAGIPKRVTTTPGTASCEIYRIDDDTLALDDASFTETVYNISLTDITEASGPVATYVKVSRDKYGYWIADGAAGSSAVTGVKWVNRSGVAIPPGGIMSATDGEIVAGIERLKGEVPGVTGKFNREWLVNASGTVVIANANNDYGHWAIDPSLPGSGAGGGVYAAISTSEGYSLIAGDAWGPKAGDFYLHPGRPGFEILSTQTITVAGVTLTQVLQTPITKVYGILRTDSPGSPDAITQGGTGKLEIWFRDTSAKRKVAGWQKLVVYDSFLNKTKTILKDSQAQAKWYSGWWELENAACEADDTGDFDAASGSSGQESGFSFSGPNVSDSFSSFTPATTLGTGITS